MIGYNKKKSTLLERDIEITQSYLKNNYNELKACNDTYLGISKVYKLINLKRLKSVFLSYTFSLSNYLASYCTLIDHMIRARNRLNNNQIKNEYQTKLKKSRLIEENKFVIDFRNYILHVKMPVVGAGFDFIVPGNGLKPGTGPSEIKDFSLSVKKEDLLNWDGWTKESLAYINGVPVGIDNQIFLQPLINNLHQSLLQFCDWFKYRISI